MNFSFSFIKKVIMKQREAIRFHALFEPWETHNTYKTAGNIS